jgi:hypothetical protein
MPELRRLVPAYTDLRDVLGKNAAKVFHVVIYTDRSQSRE